MAAQTSQCNKNIDQLGRRFLGLYSTNLYLTSNGPITSGVGTSSGVNATTAWLAVAAKDGIAIGVGTGTATTISPYGGAGGYTAYHAPGDNAFLDIIATDNRWFVAIGTGGTRNAIRVNPFGPSAESSAWLVPTTSPAAATWRSMAYGNGRIVAVSNGTATTYSTDDGANFNVGGTLTSGNWTSVAYGNGVFIAVCTSTRRCATTTDGITWTEYALGLPSTAAWITVRYNSDLAIWVAMATSGTVAAWSDNDGVTWTSMTVPSGNWRATSEGYEDLGGTPCFFSIGTSSVGLVSYDGKTWNTLAVGSITCNKLIYTRDQTWRTGDTLTISNNSKLTVNTESVRTMLNITISSGELEIINSSTTTPIRFAMGRTSAAAGANSITPSSALGKVSIQGNWIVVDTSDGTANQEFTSPYSKGDFIPILWVETGNNTNVYEMWANVTNIRDFDTVNFYYNGLRATGINGKYFTQNSNKNVLKPFKLTGVQIINGSNVIICDSTADVVPGSHLFGMACTGIVEDVLSATTFRIHTACTASRSAQTAYFFVPFYKQYTPTLKFGDGSLGAIPPNGARIRIPNIYITDYTSANNNMGAWTSTAGSTPAVTNGPTTFVGANGGEFSFDTCLFGEAVSALNQPSKVTMNYCGWSYSPTWIAECSDVNISHLGWGCPPLMQYIGSTNVTITTTFPSTTITTTDFRTVHPGSLITHTGVNKVVASIQNMTTATLDANADSAVSAQVAVWWGPWLVRDYRLGSTPSAVSMTYSKSRIYSAYVPGSNWTDILAVDSGFSLNATGNNSGQGAGGVMSGLNLAFSDNVTVNGIKYIHLGSYPRVKSYTGPVEFNTGSNCSVDNVYAKNCYRILATTLGTNITESNVTYDPSLFHEGHNLAPTAGFSAFRDLSTGDPLTLEQKYYFKTRSYKSVDYEGQYDYIDGLTHSAIVYEHDNKENPLFQFAAGPVSTADNTANLTSISSKMAFGNGVWVLLANAGHYSVILSSNNNGATWRTCAVPTANAGARWADVVWDGTYFTAVAGMIAASVASTIISIDGVHWANGSVALPTAAWTSIVYDNGLTADKWNIIGYGTASTLRSSTNNTANTITTWTNNAAGIPVANWIASATSGANRIVAIAGGDSNGTASAYRDNTTGTGYTVGGLLANSQWNSIAYGNGIFVAVSKSSTTGPIAISTETTGSPTWTASTLPTLPTGMLWGEIIYAGTAFVVLSSIAGRFVGNQATAFSQCYVTGTNVAGTITWSALKYLPDCTSWATMRSNGTAVMVVSTQTGRCAYTPNITVGSPTWTLYTNVIPAWNKITWSRQDPLFTSLPSAPTTCSATFNSNIVTTTTIDRIRVGQTLRFTGGQYANSPHAYLGTGSVGSQYGGVVVVTGILNATQFTVSSNSTRAYSGLSPTATFAEGSYTVYRSTTSGFTARDHTTKIGSTEGTDSSGVFRFDDFYDVVPGTTYYYRIVRNFYGWQTAASCSATAGNTTLNITGGGFNTLNSEPGMVGKSGTNILTIHDGYTSAVYLRSIRPGCRISCAGKIPASTTVTAITESVIELSANLIANVVDTDVVNIGVQVGQVAHIPSSGVDANGVPATVISVAADGNSLQLSANNVQAVTGLVTMFSWREEYPEIECTPQVPMIHQNYALQSTTLSSSPTWTASGITVAANVLHGPNDNYAGINVAAPSFTGSTLRCDTANGTLTQVIQTGVGPAYTAFLKARARHSDLSRTVQFKLALGATEVTHSLTNKFETYKVTLPASTSNQNNFVITLLEIGALIEVNGINVVLGSNITVPGAATTSNMVWQAPQTEIITAFGNNKSTHDARVTFTTQTTPATGVYTYNIHQGTSFGFTADDLNLTWSSQLQGGNPGMIDPVQSNNVRVTNVTQVPNTTMSTALAWPTTGSTGTFLGDSTFDFNGTNASLLAIISPVPVSTNTKLYNLDIANMRPTFPPENSVSNLNSRITLQNIRSNTGTLPYSVQTLETIYKGVAGSYSRQGYNRTYWDGTNQGTSYFTQPSPAIYGSMFREMYSGDRGDGSLNIIFNAYNSPTKPYTITGGNPQFSSQGYLYFTSEDDQIVIEWPHFIRGVTGFQNRLPGLAHFGLGGYSIVPAAVKTEYDIDKGAGYTGSWTEIGGTPSALFNESGINPATGFRIKFRFSGRKSVSLTSTNNAAPFVPGETVYNASVPGNATATATIGAFPCFFKNGNSIGAVVVTATTGTWVTGSIMYSAGGAARGTVALTNGYIFMPNPASYLNNFRVFTTVDTDIANNYPGEINTLTLTGLVSGSDVVINTSGTTVTIGEVDAGGTTFAFEFSGAQTVDIKIMKEGYVPYQIYGLALTATDSSLPIAQVVDRAFI